jgi:hypothetical protein
VIVNIVNIIVIGLIVDVNYILKTTDALSVD